MVWLDVRQVTHIVRNLTCLFNLRLARLGGGDEPGGGLRDAPGGLLQALQVSTVFICFHLDVKQQTDLNKN